MAKKHKKSKKWISWLVMLILFVAAAVVTYLVWDAYFRNKEDDRSEIDNEQTEIVDSQTAEEAEVEEVTEKPKIVQYDGDDPNSAEELSGAVTYAGVVGDNLMVRVNIDQYLEEGTCELNLLRNGATIYNSAVGIVGNVATATCEGFDVPVVEVGGGEVEIVINLNSGDKNGVIYGETSV